MIFRRNFRVGFTPLFFILSVGLLNGCGESRKETQAEKGVKPEKKTEAQSQIDSREVPEYMAEGQKVYVQYCLSCHQANGSGVARLNPPLKATEYVLGDKNRLLGIIINGANIGLDIDGETYSNAMPAFRHLSDEEVAQVASYIRNSFGNSAAPITAEEVSAFRSKNKG